MKNQQEKGRSMIEMLGVLAVIGVLSVGGVYGYTMAMRSYKANEIVNATSLMFMQGLASDGGEGTKVMSLESELLPNGCSGITYKGDKATLTVNITDQNICNQVKAKLGDKATGDCPNLTVSLGQSDEKDVNSLLNNKLGCYLTQSCNQSECNSLGLTWTVGEKCYSQAQGNCLNEQEYNPNFINEHPDGCGDIDALEEEFINEYTNCLKTKTEFYCDYWKKFRYTQKYDECTDCETYSICRNNGYSNLYCMYCETKADDEGNFSQSVCDCLRADKTKSYPDCN